MKVNGVNQDIGGVRWSVQNVDLFISNALPGLYHYGIRGILHIYGNIICRRVVLVLRSGKVSIWMTWLHLAVGLMESEVENEERRKSAREGSHSIDNLRRRNTEALPLAVLGYEAFR